MDEVFDFTFKILFRETFLDAAYFGFIYLALYIL